VIAIRVDAASGQRHVCMVEKRDGRQGFPKGGRQVGELVLVNALREWREECGIPAERLQLLPEAHMDEATTGVRYLVALCLPASGGTPGPDPPCAGEASWAPPLEDASDPDPIVLARWVAVDRVLSGDGRISRERRLLLRQAVLALNFG